MSTLADEFLQDIGRGPLVLKKEEGTKEIKKEEPLNVGVNNLSVTPNDFYLDFNDVDEVTNILKDEYLRDLEKRVEEAYTNMNLNDNPNYDLIVEANEKCMVLTEEIFKIYKFLRHHYSKRLC